MKSINGRRIEDRGNSSLEGVQDGDYWFDTRTQAFVAACPCNHTGDASSIVLADLSKHNVVVHSDNTITVHPSILVNTTVGIDNNICTLYHGFLEKGMWRTE